MSQALLFVDDDDDDIKLTLLGFRQQGFTPEVIVARDGKEALERLFEDYAASRPLPQAILTDLKMPRMDGLEFMRRLKEDPRLVDIPVGFLSSSSSETDVAEALRLGAKFYFQKPDDLDEYAGLVKELQKIMLPRETNNPSGEASRCVHERWP
jgi:CheY-like chemotaxis protein